MAKSGAKKIIFEYLKEHVGEDISRDVLDELVNHSVSWERAVRTLRDDGFELIVKRGKPVTYCLTSVKPVNKPKDNRNISDKLRAMVILRDSSICQMCGRSVHEDGIKIQIDHIIPFEWGGKTVIENLQCLCSQCNNGKKNWEKGENPELMEEISKSTSTKERLKKYFEFYQNIEIGVEKLEVISKTRSWTRQLRYLREEYNMDIEYIRPSKANNRKEAYIFHKKEQNENDVICGADLWQI